MQHPLNEIEAFFKKLAKEHKNLVTFVDSIGETTLKKPMFAVHITVKDIQEKPKVYIQCLVHASKYYSLHELQPCIHSPSLIIIIHNNDDNYCNGGHSTPIYIIYRYIYLA